MNLHRSLKKSIAAYLALAMLTVPLSGCSRTATTGGLSGRGVIGDFLVGGFYGGAMGGFLRPEEPLPDGAIVLELPRPNDLRLTTELVGMDALRYYTHARIATEKLSRMNAQNSKPEEYAKLLKETAELWKLADHFADMANQFAKHLSKEEKKPGYKPLAMIDRSPFGKDIFFSVAYAREGTDADEARHRPMTGEERRDMEAHPDWAEGIMNTYKQFPAGRGIEGLSHHLGVDAKEANRQFQKAVSVLDQDKVFGIPTGMSSQTAGNLYNVGAKTAMTTRVACKTALLVGGAILTGGATGTAATVGVVNTLASGADLVIEVSNTALELLTDKTDPTLDKIQQYTSSIAAITSLGTLITSYSDFAVKGEKAVEATHKALQGAGLQNTKGLLDQFDKGGSGISLLADTASWSVDRGLELSDGKILGFNVIRQDGKTAIVPGDMGQGVYGPPTPLDQLAEKELNTLYAPNEAEARAEAIRELTKIVEALEKQKHEALQQAAEQAKKETEALTLYTPEKLAGTYVLTSQREIVIDERETVTYVTQLTVSPGAGGQITMTDNTGDSFTVVVDPKTGQGSSDGLAAGMVFTATGGGGYTFHYTDHKTGTSATWRKQ